MRLRWAALLLAVGTGSWTWAADEIIPIGKDKLWNAPRPDKADLSVQYISRTPRFPGLQPKYVNINDPVLGVGETGPVQILNDGAQRWPRAGQTVRFTAVLRNAGTQPIARFDWHWLFDGKDIASGWHEQPLAPNETVEFMLERPWEDGRHFIAFEVDRHRLLDEITRENNWVIDRTDALSYAFFVEESVHAAFKQYRNGLGSYDWADWAQFQVRQSNKEFRDTIYPSTPDGIEERVRLDRVYIIPDGWGHTGGMHTPGVHVPVDLDNPQFYNANEPPEGLAETEVFNNVNGGVDGVWGFTVDLLKPDENKGGKNFYEFAPRWLTSSEWPLHHELGHQLGRNDHYLIVAEGRANLAIPGLGYRPPADYRDGMMFHGNYSHDRAIGMNHERWDSTYRFYCEHSARSLNRDKGVRRGLFGEYLFDVPRTNMFTFVGADRRPVAEAEIELFVGKGRGYTGGGFNAEPNYRGRTDARGVYTLNRSPWPHVFIWGNNGVLMFRVTPSEGAAQVGFLDISHFNLAYWRGHEERAEHVVRLETIPGAAAGE
ncbi:MAG: hypothetical protein IPM18_11395 [Phycisphaerales bacterium]|nr:hypothetical protein [Phycisphaerales bacterium]